MSRYEVTPDGSYVVHDYNSAPPFSSFLPGIAGLWGIPLWAYYVNRGQAVCTFGTQDKEHAIAEFDSAVLHQHRAGQENFRTLIKIGAGGAGGFYEPFRTRSRYRVANRMVVRPHMLSLHETNADLGLAVDVEYTTAANQPFAALVRRVTVTNTGAAPLDVELLDGLAKIAPFGVELYWTKFLPFVTMGYLQVLGLEEHTPFFKLKAQGSDSWRHAILPAGNFYCGVVEGKSDLLPAVVDPALVFGDGADLVEPYAFIDAAAPLDPSRPQGRHCQVCCAMLHRRAELAPGQSVRILAACGTAAAFDRLAEVKQWLLAEGAGDRAFEASRLEVAKVAGRFFVHTAEPSLNHYLSNTYVDNVLRGGLPITLDAGGRKLALHVYSRKHGDLERDYNMFLLEPTFFSQGNGNFRDVNQNRRHDVWINPDVGADNLRYFFNLVQLDGFNPLVCKGSRFRVTDAAACRAAIARHLGPAAAISLPPRLAAPFTPGTLFAALRDLRLAAPEPMALLCDVLAACERLEDAEFGQGYWTDHWLYNFDHLDSFLAIFPERRDAVVFDDAGYTYRDSDMRILRRDEKYDRTADGAVRQVDSVALDETKRQLIRSRTDEPYRLRTALGRGDIYRCNLLQKMLCIVVNKMASFAPSGIGIDMEAGHPGWHDSINGLPGVFGSSTSEIFHLLRAIRTVDGLLAARSAPGTLTEPPRAAAVAREGSGHSASVFALPVPVELASLMDAVNVALGDRAAGGNDFAYWDACTTAKETFRAAIRFGIDGAERTSGVAELRAFCAAAADHCRASLARCRAAAGRLTPITYSRHKATAVTPVLDAGAPRLSSEGSPCVSVQAFEHHPLPLFLEAPSHALRTGYYTGQDARELHREIEAGPLFDRELGMYILGDSVQAEGPEVGRIWSWAPGWFENENVFLHSEHKYLLGLLHAGAHDEFFTALRRCLTPFQPLDRYARNPLENASFIMSSRQPRPAFRGRGFQPRSSGTTAEVLEMFLVMSFGLRPFRFEAGELSLHLAPILPEWIFSRQDERRTWTRADGHAMTVDLPADSYTATFLGSTLVTHVNPRRRPTYGPDAAAIRAIALVARDGATERLAGPVIRGERAAAVRARQFERIVCKWE